MKIAILLYGNMTALDAIGPYEVLSRLPGAEVRFAAGAPGLLKGLRATTHWARLHVLETFGAQSTG